MRPDWRTLRYPAPLRPGDTIAVTAPSAGVSGGDLVRLDLCLDALRAAGFEIREGECLRSSTETEPVSGSREKRAAELLAFWRDPDVRAIFPPWGGTIAIHLVSALDFEAFRELPPTWMLGYSDTSTILTALTLTAGVATAHGPTLMEMIPEQTGGDVHERWREVLATPEGGVIEQRSGTRWQRSGARWSREPDARFRLEDATEWKAARRGVELDEVAVRGRLIGGCLETVSMLAGSPFGDMDHFRARSGSDGVLVYLENAESSPDVVCRLLWHLRLAGWFDGVEGILLGRSAGPEHDLLSQAAAMRDALWDLDVPVLYDLDIGHQPPQMTLVNGAVATVTCAGGAGRLTLELR